MGHSGQFLNLNNMAASLWRTSTSLLRRSLTLANVRCAGGPPAKPVDQHKGKYATDEITMPDKLGHAVGIERVQELATEYEEDALTIQWLTIYKGEPKRCECGYWFKLVDAQT